MPLYFFKASDGTRKIEDTLGAQFADDAMAVREVLETVRVELGASAASLVITDDLGREVLRREPNSK